MKIKWVLFLKLRQVKTKNDNMEQWCIFAFKYPLIFVIFYLLMVEFSLKMCKFLGSLVIFNAYKKDNEKL